MYCKNKILFLGGSITQGRISSSFVEMLKKRLGTKRFAYINQGVAGYESYNVWFKLDKALKTRPDFVILLVGTNDVMSSLDPGLGKLSRKLKKIPHEPTLFHYSENMTWIIRRLKEETLANIAAVSLPVLGENLDSIENKTIAEYNNAMKKITETEKVTYITVHEKQVDFLLSKAGRSGKDCVNSTKMAFRSLLQHYLLFRSLDTISAKNGFILLTDGIHMNSTGAKFIADEIEDFIRVLSASGR
jgi:lysophospholipase L1-like esterase